MSISRRLPPAVVGGLVLAACTSAPPPTAAPGASQPAAIVSPTPPAQSATATANATMVALDLPNPGGTCVAAQFHLGAATLIGEPATFDSIHVGMTQPLTNTGPQCALVLPTIIGLAPAAGSFVRAAVGNLGIEVYKNGVGKTAFPTSFTINAGQAVKIVFNAYWRYTTLAGSPAPPDCTAPLRGISRAEFPFASGTIEIDWITPIAEVCAPAQFSMTIENIARAER